VGSEQGGKGKPQAKSKKKSVIVQQNLMPGSDSGLAQMNYTNSIYMCCGNQHITKIPAPSLLCALFVRLLIMQ
jgi:hypothetical protein